MRTILYMPTIDWDFLKQRPQHILSQFAKNGWRVIYCNQTQLNRKPEEVEKNLFVHYNFHDVVEQIQKNKLKIDVAYATWAKSHVYYPIIKAKINIYDSVDSFPEWHPFEFEACKKADIVLTSSQYLFDLRKKMHNNVYLVRNACDSSFINVPFKKPNDLIGFNGPIVGFVGAIGSWVKTSLIKKVADKYTTVFIGREFGNVCPSNVKNLGVKSHSDLINYYQTLDVCLLPFNTKLEITQAADPIKLYEHMSCGKVTVSTDWPEVRLYPNVVLPSQTDEEFLLNVDRAIELSKKPEIKRQAIEFAKNNTWEQRYSKIENAIYEYSKRSGKHL